MPDEAHVLDDGRVGGDELRNFVQKGSFFKLASFQVQPGDGLVDGDGFEHPRHHRLRQEVVWQVDLQDRRRGLDGGRDGLAKFLWQPEAVEGEDAVVDGGFWPEHLEP